MSEILYNKIYPKCLSRAAGGQPEKLTLQGESCVCDCYFGRLNTWYDRSHPDPHRAGWPIADPANLCRLLPKSVAKLRHDLMAQKQAEEWQRFIHNLGGAIVKNGTNLIVHLVDQLIPDCLNGSVGGAVNVRALATAAGGVVSTLSRYGWSPLSKALGVLPGVGASALDLQVISAIELMIMKGQGARAFLQSGAAGAGVSFSASIDRWANFYLSWGTGMSTLGASASATLIYGPAGKHANREKFNGWYQGNSVTLQASPGPDPAQVGALISTDGSMGVIVGLGTPGASIMAGTTYYVCNLVNDLDWQSIGAAMRLTM